MPEQLEKETKVQLIRRIKELRKMNATADATITNLGDQLWEQRRTYDGLTWTMRTREDKIRAACAIFINLNVQEVGPASLVLIQRFLQEALDWQFKNRPSASRGGRGAGIGEIPSNWWARVRRLGFQEEAPDGVMD